VDGGLGDFLQYLEDGVLGPLLIHDSLLRVLEVFLKITVHLDVPFQLTLSVLLVLVEFLDPQGECLDLLFPGELKFIQGFTLRDLQCLEAVIETGRAFLHFLCVCLLFLREFGL
jgi:hypothetical protein